MLLLISFEDYSLAIWINGTTRIQRHIPTKAAGMNHFRPRIAKPIEPPTKSPGNTIITEISNIFIKVLVTSGWDSVVNAPMVIAQAVT